MDAGRWLRLYDGFAEAEGRDHCAILEVDTKTLCSPLEPCQRKAIDASL